MTENQPLKENQQGLIIMVGLLFLLLLVLGTYKVDKGMAVVNAKHQALELAGQISAGGLNALPRNSTDEDSQSPGRNPSSLGLSQAKDMARAGSIGEDPWGNSYSFRRLGEQNRGEYVVVWSSGPNGRRETSETEIRRSLTGAIHFKGDDLGVTLKVAAQPKPKD